MAQSVNDARKEWLEYSAKWPGSRGAERRLQAWLKAMSDENKRKAAKERRL